MGYVYGIDLGTTYSCIAYIDEYGKAIVLKNSEGEHTTPSVVMMESKNNIIVGNEAKRSIDLEPTKTIQFVKRKMGKENNKVIIDDIEYTATEISARILEKIVKDANEELRQTGVLADGEGIKDVVITCPAYFGMNEREATKKAGELVGLNVLDIINEPTAAAISYGVSGAEKNETVLVYDLGGGTFDITVMNIVGNAITVICTAGDDQLGGKDWDERLVTHIIERYEEEFEQDLSEDIDAMAALFVDAESVKKSLTTREKANLSVNGPAGRLREEITREQYEALTKTLLARTKNLLDDAINTATKQGYPLSKIDKVLLVGGSSRMPQVAAMLENDYHVKPTLADPDEAVAKGAALYASNTQKYKDFVQQEAHKAGVSVEQMQENNLLTGVLDQKFALAAGAMGGMQLRITNVLSRTYGIEVHNQERNRGEIDNILMINDKLPASKTREYSTYANNQGGVDLKIYETRSTEEFLEIDGKTPLTTIEMRFKQAVPKDTPLVVAISLDASGLLHIIAEEKQYNTRLDTTFQLANQMSDDEISGAMERIASVRVE